MTTPVAIHPLVSPWGRFGLYSFFIDAPEPAIVDTGITLAHQDITRPDGTSKVIESRNWYDGGDVLDAYGHGTHVAGIAAALTDNGVGVAGVCPNCSLLNAKVCDNFGGCPYDRIANGILWSVGCEWRDARDRCLSPVRAKAI